MPAKNEIINIAYHFFAEAMIVFLFATPFMNGEYQWIPYWSYLALILGVCVLYSVYSFYSKGFAWYIVTTPLIILIFFLVGYPFVLSVAFPILFTFRYIFLRKDSMLSRESVYLNVTIPLAVFLLIWIRDPEIIIYTFLLLTLLLGGNIYSHLFNLKKKERHYIGQKMWLTLGSFTALFAIAIFLLFSFRDVFNKMWYGLMEIPGYLGGKVGMLVGYFFPNPKPPEAIDDQDMANLFGEGDKENADQFNELLPERNESSIIEEYDYLIYWSIGVIILTIVIIMAVRHFRNRFDPVAEPTDHITTHYNNLETEDETDSSIFRRLFRAPNNRIRKLIYQFERDAEKVNASRYPYETVDAWMERLGFDVDLTTYKKVRYGGNDNVNDEEAQMLKEQLHKMRNTLKKNRDER